MVCQKCGLPEELCVCESIAKETQKITISVEQKRLRKLMTIVKGIDASKINIKELASKLKTQLACGGTIKDNHIELQGDHRKRAKQLLVREGFSEEIIEII
ncbi:MAG: translation initiation factor [Candidatus Aenigmarchaeota archaeon]|nr:translation initiation factor [Candidatus Aenigmarchaeota archaeon]